MLLLAFGCVCLGHRQAHAQQSQLLGSHLGVGNRTYLGQDIYVAPGQQIHNATCLFCSVQIEGDLSGHAFVLFGNLTVVGRVIGGVTVIGGNAVIDGQARVGGTTAVLGGNAVYESDESLSGDAWVLGGHVSTFAGTRARNQRRIALSPMAASGIALVALLLLLPLFFVRHPAPVRAE